MLFGGVSNWLTARDAKECVPSPFSPLPKYLRLTDRPFQSTERRIALELGSKYLKTYGADLSPELEAAILSSSAPAIVEKCVSSLAALLETTADLLIDAPVTLQH